MSARAQLTGQVGEHSRKSVPYTEALRDVLEEVHAVLDHACSLIETEGKQSLEYWAAVSALGGLNQHFNFLVQEEGPDTPTLSERIEMVKEATQTTTEIAS